MQGPRVGGWLDEAARLNRPVPGQIRALASAQMSLAILTPSTRSSLQALGTSTPEDARRRLPIFELGWRDRTPKHPDLDARQRGRGSPEGLRA